MRQATVNGILVTRPTRQDVLSLAVGDLAPDCFGRMSRVTKIFARGTDVKGRAYVGFYTAFGTNNGTITGSMKEDETVCTVPLTSAYRTSSEYPKIF